MRGDGRDTAGGGDAEWWRRLGGALRGRWAPVVRPGGGLVRCEPEWSWQTVLPDHDLWCVLDGRGQAVVNGGAVVDLSAGVLLMLRPGDAVRARLDPHNPLTVGYRHYDLGDDPAVPCPPELLPPRVVRLDDVPAVRGQLEGLDRLHRHPGPDTPVRTSAALAGLLLEVHAQAARQAGALPPLMDRRVQDVVRWLTRHPAARLELAEAAESAGLSADRFSRLFRRETGTTFREYCVRVRIDRACELLSDGGMPVRAVAAALGYDDHRLFARQFRGRTDLPPGEWRRSR